MTEATTILTRADSHGVDGQEVFDCATDLERREVYREMD